MASPVDGKKLTQAVYGAISSARRMQCALILHCIIQLTNCHNVFTTDKTQIRVGGGNLSIVPANHRTSTDEISRVSASNTTSNLNANRMTNTLLDELPFNVDFVEQPDQFEVGQSFFMPAQRAPPIVPAYAPVQQDQIQDGARKWSIALDGIKSSATNQTHRLQRNQQSHTKYHASDSPAPLITFDDDDASSESKNPISTLVTSGRFAPSEPVSNSSDLSFSESDRLRRQAEVELQRSLAEQGQLVRLLSHRYDGADRSVPMVRAGIGSDKTTATWAKRRNSFVPLQQTNGYMRGQLPSNHIVRHPKLKKSTPQLTTVAKLHLSQAPKIFSNQQEASSSSRSSASPVSTAGFSQPELSGTQLMINRRQYPDGIADIVQSHQVSSPRKDQSSSVQYVRDYPSMTRQHSDPLTPVDDPRGARVRLGSSYKPTRDETSGNYEEDTPDDADAPETTWRNYPSASTVSIEPDDDLEDTRYLARPESSYSTAASNGFEPYQHKVFSDPIMEYAGRDADRLAHRYASYTSVVPRYAPPRGHRNQRPYDNGPLAHPSYKAPPSVAGSESAPRRGAFNDYQDRQSYELSPRIVPSGSHKVIHIHTKEKKSHGKYLWPILGGGLTMLMGFLIISNMLLSIPLLAMGASSLFGNYHTQQLVPVYNVSALVRPTGRRRKRWASAGLELAKQKGRLDFTAMLQRVMAKFAIRNRCKAVGFLPAVT